MTKSIFLTIQLSLCFFLCWGCATSSKLENIPNKQITQATLVPSIKSKIEIKPLVDFFSLANKSVLEIEKMFGKPVVVDTKFVQHENGEFRHYKIFKNVKNDLPDLQVDYFKGKAIGLYINIPKDFQKTSIEETIQLCGFDLKAGDSQIGGTGDDYWWDRPTKSQPFYSIHIRKFSDSGLFYTCEAHIKVQ